MSGSRCIAAAVGMAAMVWATSVGADGASSNLQLQPAEVNMGMFFDGARVGVKATVPAGEAAAVVCTGEEQHLELKKKGKVWGFLWMNVDEVKLKHVPSLYLLSTSHPISRLAGRDVLEKLGIGYPAVESAVGGEKGDVFSEVIKLKEREGMFSVEEKGLRGAVTGKGPVQLSGSFELPAHIPPGDYTVKLYGFKQGQGRLLAEEKLRLDRVGLAAMITSLAHEHGLLYGIFAVVVALGVGILTGFIFRKGMQKAH